MPEKTLDKVIHKCKLHKDKSDKKLLDAISSHNKKFNKPEQLDERKAEYKKIEKMSNPKVSK